MPQPTECPNCKGAKIEKLKDGVYQCLEDKCGIPFKFKDGEPTPAGKSKLDEHEERIKRLEESGKSKKPSHDEII